MKLSTYLLPALLVVGLMACTASTEENRTDRPNIILIMADDMGWETLRMYGGQDYETPNLDRLAAGGMQFQHCYATPLCTPSRVQLMTGKYNFRNYIGFGLLDPGEVTFGNLLRDAGYATCIVGKWQLYGNARQRELAGRGGTLPGPAGFEHYRLWQVKDRGFRYKTPTLETAGAGLETFPEEYGPDKFVEYVEDFIEAHRDTNFLVYYPMCLVHDPFLPSPDSDDYAGYDPEQRTNDTTYFRDMMAYMDREVGRIVDKVEALGLRENTLILFTGDNGTDRDVVSRWRGQRLAGQKGYTVEAGTHVPLIASWPGQIAAGSKNEHLVDFTDFLPTLLEAAQSAPPPDLTLDGLSFYAQLLGRDGPVRDHIFCHYDPRWGNFPARRYVQDKSWKLYEDGRFYHFAEDPLEAHPVPDEQLSAALLQLKRDFRRVLERMR